MKALDTSASIPGEFAIGNVSRNRSHSWTWNIRPDGTMTIWISVYGEEQQFDLTREQSTQAIHETVLVMTGALRIFAEVGKGADND